MVQKGNLLVAQSGGPTTVINSSLCGVIEEAKKHRQIQRVLASKNGVLGVLKEELMDLYKEKPTTIAALRRTPAAAAGSCRYKLKSLEKNRADYERILEVFKAHNIRYFIYCGGNDSMDTADKVNKLARQSGYELRVIGVPKTIDNDLAFTDHCPGYGSVAKYIATSVMEAGRDTDALYTTDTATVFETMGRNAGWIAAAAGMAHRSEEDAPHLVYVPEIPFRIEKFIKDCKKVLKKFGRIFIAASEGLVNEKGEYIAQAGGAFAKDAFGHTQLGGVADALRAIVETEVKVKCRTIRPSTAQREAMHFASLTDSNEAYMAGAKAVELAVAGETGWMVTLVRKPGKTYRCTTGLARLLAVANGEKRLPRSMMNREGNQITEKMRHYLLPLMRGEVPIKVGKDGLPVYARLEEHYIPKKCAAYRI